jgi:hypothetical protein
MPDETNRVLPLSFRIADRFVATPKIIFGDVKHFMFGIIGLITLSAFDDPNLHPWLWEFRVSLRILFVLISLVPILQWLAVWYLKESLAFLPEGAKLPLKEAWHVQGMLEIARLLQSCLGLRSAKRLAEGLIRENEESINYYLGLPKLR